ncbi:MAG: S8 family peptidase [Flavobacteriales bacterium]
MKNALIAAVAFTASTTCWAQSKPAVPSVKDINQWHMLDASADGPVGVSAIRAYNELLKNKTATPVVVAIIDSGTESFHEDLRENIWVNQDEVPGNGQDDDKNGYVDDVHGWSFIGGPGGDVSADNLEFTRIFRIEKARFEKVTDASQVAKADKADYEHYIKMKAEYERRMEEAQGGLMQIAMIEQFAAGAKDAIKEHLGKENYTVIEVEGIETDDEFLAAAKGFIIMSMKDDINAQIEEGRKYYQTQTDYQLNLDFDPRSMVGDNYSDINERHYGNNHIDGPEAEHGTHVGGIVGAVWNNIGMDGICGSAKLMVIRCVPEGDERDKDVANAIRYAVDNGARVVNMSFGKSFSPGKSAVDEAAKYAESKGVLLVHAAGNDSKDIDVQPNFPKDTYADGGVCSTWLEIGASGPIVEALTADFSNYGKKSVDVFAPGVDIYSTIPGNKYKDNSGTSMAAPVASGVAATIMSYYPNLSATDVKAIMMKSAVDYGKVKMERTVERKAVGKFFARIFIGKKKNESSEIPPRIYKTKTVRFSEMSITGGVINLYEAIKMAENWKK